MPHLVGRFEAAWENAMAAKTPTTTKTTAGYVDPALGLYGCGPNTKTYSSSVIATATNNLKTDVKDLISNRNGLKLSIFFFSDIDAAGDTWTSGLPNIKACAWQPADATDDKVSAVCTAKSTGTITFVAQNANSEGWLWVLHGS